MRAPRLSEPCSHQPACPSPPSALASHFYPRTHAHFLARALTPHTPRPTPLAAPRHCPRSALCTQTPHRAGAVAAMVERLGEAHDEALAEIEEREKQYAALYGDGDDEILSSPGL